MRKIAAILVTLGLTLGLLGAGIGATFTDSAVAQTSITVGSFNIDVSTTMTGCTVADGTSVTCTLPAIQSSAPASAAFPFTVTSTGTIPANISVAAVLTGGTARFSDLLGAVAPFQLTQGQSHVFAGGIQWSELVPDDLGRTVTITYTISASA